MADWMNENDGGGAGDGYDWGAPGPSKDFAPLKERNDYHGDAGVESARDDTCRNCGQPGHFARECPEPHRGGGGACFNCGEEGHNKVDCPHPRVFKGTCRICAQEGHPAFECPQKPADVCKNCRKEGHKTSECKDNRQFDLNDIPDETPEKAWEDLKKADADHDLDDFRDAFKVYTKAQPSKTFVDIEMKLRAEQANVYLIALGKEKEGFETYTLIDLQGKLDRTYVVKFFFGPEPRRASLKERWPTSQEENLERLADAGFEYDRMIPKCYNCGEMGHSSKACKQERTAPERVEIQCANCSEVGHRVRDCTKQRTSKFGCRNCGAPDHKAADCLEPPNLDNIECRRCNEKGHFAKDCPSATARTCRKCGAEDHISRDCDRPQNMDLITCNNCDETGHYGRECPKPRDWSRVKCTNCGEMGHTFRRCAKPSADADGTLETAGGAGEFETSHNIPVEAPVGNWDNGGETQGGSSW